MSKIKYSEMTSYDLDMIFNLYNDAQWHAYTQDMDLLLEGFKHSLKVIAAYDEGVLVGLVRVVGDGVTIIYIQDLIVLKSHHKLGIGSTLLEMITQHYASVRQKVLISEAVEHLIKFYNQADYIELNQVQAVGYLHVQSNK